MKRLACLHGFTGRPEVWQPVVEHLPSQVEVSCLTLLGHDHDSPADPAAGSSTKTAETPDTFSGFSCFEREVDRLAELLRRQARHGWHLVGYSMGARVGLGMLIRHQELFASARLLGVHPGIGTVAERSDRLVADGRLVRRLLKDGLEKFIDHWQALPLFATQKTLPAETLRQQRQSRLRHSAASLAEALTSLGLARMPNYQLDLPTLDLPVRLMAGEHDMKFCRLAREMVDLLPHGKVEIVPQAGHNLVLEVPSVVAAAIQGDMFHESI